VPAKPNGREVSVPIRMCVGCRQRAPKAELLRLVWNEGPVVDVAQSEPGRGVYQHRDVECLERAARRRSMGRALRIREFDHGIAAAIVRSHLGDTGAIA
jgi:predicted RNA-binding protein YlxR (DUF448 family)